ncbi:MAG TPA: response regulator [Nitrososphaeraceae archaeon]|nr:response regulator [Nitrososphaeraceae archaeon]
MKNRILIVDDESDTSLTLKVILENYNYIVDSFDDPIIALKNFKSGLYDLLILDIFMSQISGIKLYQEIRKIDQRVKVCFLTAGQMNLTGLVNVSGDSDGSIIIPKPIANKELLNTVHAIINSRHLTCRY